MAIVLLREAKTCVMGRSQMKTNLRARAQAQEVVEPEYGDSIGVRQTFGIRKAYELLNQGFISGVLLRTGASGRGRRLFSYTSIRQYLRSLESTGDAAPKSNAAENALAARMEKAAAREAYKRGEDQ
jgi:hypothetical protein